MIKFKVDGSVVSVQEKEALYAGAKDVYTCCFAFDGSWNRYSKSAVFRMDGRAITAVINEEGCCILPWELLVSENIGKEILVGVYGVSAEGEILTTVWDSIGAVRRGTELGEDARDPSEGIYEQVMASMKHMEATVTGCSEEAKTAAQRAETAAAQAREAAKNVPVIGINGTWWIGDIDTGISALGREGPRGEKGNKGDKGDQGEKGENGTGVKVQVDAASCTEIGDAYIDSDGNLMILTALPNTFTNGGQIKGPKGDKGDPGDKGDTGATGAQGEKGDKGDKGDTGSKGADGVSVTHSWSGTTLTVTSASGTSSANLKGDKGDTGATGAQGEQGIQGIQGEKGDKGDKGDTGAAGATGANATINGVNALTLNTGTGISGSQSGSTYTLSLASHNQAASTIAAGTFAGQVVAKSSAQTPATSLLRNSKLVSAETTPTVNGEIFWTYE